MIDLSWSHILLVVIVALVVVGPKDLPKLMRTVGRWMGKARQMAEQFRKSFDDMTREAELDELRAEIEALRTGRPFAGVMRDLQQPVLPPEYGAKPGAPAPQQDAADPTASAAATTTAEGPKRAAE
jgi:sec-independent protein translocase protein TatB